MTCIWSHVLSVIRAGIVASSSMSWGTGCGFPCPSFFPLCLYKLIVFVSSKTPSFQHCSEVSGRPFLGDSKAVNERGSGTIGDCSRQETSSTAGPERAQTPYGNLYVTEQMIQSDYPWFVQRFRSTNSCQSAPNLRILAVDVDLRDVRR